jgi:Sortase and related acyltransferases
MIRDMRETDVDAVVGMLKSGFPENTHAYMTCTQRGFGAFLRVAARYPYPRSDRVQVIAADNDDAAVGFAEFKVDRARSEALLSYICVDPQERGKGLARTMINRFIVEHADVKSLSLDVFEDNLTARNLYHSLGFVDHGTMSWLVRDVVPRQLEYSASGALEKSLAMHDRYGFCVLDTNGPEGAVALGVLGDEVVRCFDAPSFNDDAIVSRSSAYFPSIARAFVSLPTGHETHPDAKVIKSVNRLVLSLGEDV